LIRRKLLPQLTVIAKLVHRSAGLLVGASTSVALLEDDQPESPLRGSDNIPCTANSGGVGHCGQLQDLESSI
jgi:hypothetical protein